MRFAMLAAAAALGKSASASAAVLVTIFVNAAGTKTDYCNFTIPECAAPLGTTPISRQIVQTFSVPSVIDGQRFEFESMGFYLPATRAGNAGTLARNPDGSFGGINYLHVEGSAPSSPSFFSIYELRASTFGVTFDGAVPEPATWAMMIGGFGAIGAAMRRRRTATSRQLTT